MSSYEHVSSTYEYADRWCVVWGDVYMDELSTCEAPNVPLVKLLSLHWLCKFL